MDEQQIVIVARKWLHIQLASRWMDGWMIDKGTDLRNGYYKRKGQLFMFAAKRLHFKAD